MRPTFEVSIPLSASVQVVPPDEHLTKSLLTGVVANNAVVLFVVAELVSDPVAVAAMLDKFIAPACDPATPIVAELASWRIPPLVPFHVAMVPAMLTVGPTTIGTNEPAPFATCNPLPVVCPQIVA